MCNHIFDYPTDSKENYNSDNETLTGVCRCCGTKQKAYGMRWSISREESFLQEVPYEQTQFNYIDKTTIIC